MFIFPAQIELPNAEPAKVADTVAVNNYHFHLDQWIPNHTEALRGAGTAAGIALLGLVVFLAARKYIRRACLTVAYVITVIVAALYFGIAGAKPARMLDRDDLLSLWLDRLVIAALLFAALRALDRLLIVPLMSRGGKNPVHRFFHQIVNIVIFLFAVLGYGAWEFGWDINKFLAGSAVISIVLGLALQETLGNFFSGLVMQASSPFAIGDWIVCAGVEGRVADMTWRAVTIHTPEDNYVIVPNGTVAKEQIVNFNAPTASTARAVRVGLAYELPPADAVACLKAAALESPGVLATPEPYVYLFDFADSAIVYELKFWIDQAPAHRKIEEQVRTHVWYRLRERGYEIPFPIRSVEHVSVQNKMRKQLQSASDVRYRTIAESWLFAPLSDEEKHVVADGAGDLYLAAGQVVFRQDDAGDSLFVVRKGEVEVLARHGTGPEAKVATLKAGDFFGEMSALTGQPRTATIRAATALACVEIKKQVLAGVFKADPAIMDKISRLIAERNAERLAIAQDAATAASRQETVASQQKSLLGRMMRFFGYASPATAD